jgi:putative sigma-54 modulation protein
VQVTIAIRHGQLTPEHQAEVVALVEKLHHFYERVGGLTVTVDLAGLEKTVEITGHANHKHHFVAHASAPELMAAVHAAVAKMKQQMKHYKESMQDHRRDPSHGGEGGIHP